MGFLHIEGRERFYAQDVALRANPQIINKIMTQHFPPYLQPRPKAVPTLSDASGVSKASSATPPHLSRPPSQSRQSSPAAPLAAIPVASAKATRALIRRVLCPETSAATKENRPLNELLPPLTSSNDIDFELYAIIAIVIKDTVHSWYGKITPDHSFVEEVIQIVAHCTRAIEGRLRSVDLEALVFDELPELIENHVRGEYHGSLNVVSVDLIRSQHTASPVRLLLQVHFAQTLGPSTIV